MERGDDAVHIRGRKRDQSRDAVILEATIDILAEGGYDAMTMDMVALRANAGKATVYRRWPSKVKLVVEAVAHMKRNQVDVEQLPDTGSLRDDLLGLFKAESPAVSNRRMKVMAALTTMLSQNFTLTQAETNGIQEPWIAANRVLIQRAIDRGELRDDANVEIASHVVPSMATYRTLVERRPVTKAFLISVIDGVLLPALRKAPL